MTINLVAEGFMEKIVATRILPFCGHELGTVYGERGYVYIKQKATAFRWLATENSGVLVLTDFRDTGVECPPAALKTYIYNKLPNPPVNFLCRFAVNEMESWLLADREGIAKFFNIAISRLPIHPENESAPKLTLVNLARKSNKKAIREGIAPPVGHRAVVGPEYTSLMYQFILNFWNIDNAAGNAPSLERCILRLKELSII